METISRRECLFFLSTILGLAIYPGSRAFATTATAERVIRDQFPVSIAVLQAAYVSEMVASSHYDEYYERAVTEGYPNIAYLFRAFSLSERIHADNYKKVLASLGTSFEDPLTDIQVSDTRANVMEATKNELIKIRETYPYFLSRLEDEAYDEAVITCMYSWKSHKQHEKKIAEIKRYSKYFFGSVAKKIEGVKLDFHVCEICGSTIDATPVAPCEICNHAASHYIHVQKPS